MNKISTALLSSHHAYIATGFLGLPTWYEFLPTNADGGPSFQSLTDIYLIIAAVIDILLRIGAIIAIVMVIYGGIEFITSSGNPDKASSARSTITNAIIGLAIAVSAATVVTYIAGRFTT
jgi:hypothetical protein